MPRRPREQSESGYYHIVLRGTNRQNIFEDTEDYRKFLEVLELCKAVSGFKLYAYCLMSNHVHLLLRIGQEPLEQVFKRIGVRYVGWYNHKYGRSGHLFQDRFKSQTVEDERRLLTVLRYIHQNPVKAGMCGEVGEYQWTSYKDYKSGGGITDTSEVLLMISEKREEALRKLEKMVYEPVKEGSLDIEITRRRFSDSEVKGKLDKLCGVERVSDFQELSEEIRKETIAKLRREGISIRQIARVTGTSFGVVRKI